MSPSDVPKPWRWTFAFAAFIAVIIFATWTVSDRAEARAGQISAATVAPVNADLQTHKATEELRHQFEDAQLKEIKTTLEEIRDRLPPKRNR